MASPPGGQYPEHQPLPYQPLPGARPPYQYPPEGPGGWVPIVDQPPIEGQEGRAPQQPPTEVPGGWVPASQADLPPPSYENSYGPQGPSNNSAPYGYPAKLEAPYRGSPVPGSATAPYHSNQIV